MEVSVTERGAFRDCRRRWRWEYVLGYKPRLPNVNAWIGIGVHAGLQSYYTAGRDSALEAYDAWLKSELNALKRLFGCLWGLGRATYEEAGDLGRSILSSYVEYDARNPLPGKILYAPESSLKVDIPNTTHCLKGRIDLVIENNSEVWVVDHKVYSVFPKLGGLDVDDQLTAYCYLIYKTCGVIPRGVMLNFLLKARPEPPRVLTTGKLSKDKSQKTTYDLYRQTIESLGLDMSEYQDMLTYLKEAGYAPFFQRQVSPRSKQDLLAFEETIVSELKDMDLARQDESFAYPNGRMTSCGYCSFLSPCRVKMGGGDAEFGLNAEFLRSETSKEIFNEQQPIR